MDDEKTPVEKPSRRVLIGSSVISLLGVTFGSCLIVAGSALTWRSDRILGLYNQSGWSYRHVVSGDGKITLVLGSVMAISLVLGVVLQSRAAYAIACGADVLVAAFTLYELIYLFTGQGVVSPGNGLYMVLGGSVAGFLCSLGGYLMMTEKHLQNHENEGAVVPEPSGAS